MNWLGAFIVCCSALAAYPHHTFAQGAADDANTSEGTTGTLSESAAPVVVILAPGGDAEDAQKERAAQALERSVQASGFEALFVAALASIGRNPKVAHCQESDCALAAALKRSAHAIAGVSVWKKGASRMQTTLTITWKSLQEANADEQFTDIPLVGELSIEAAVASGVSKFLSAGDDSIAVTIDSDPQGAAATVDGKPLGKTPLKVKLKPGGHELTLMLDERFEPARQAIMVAATSTRFEVPLERKAAMMALEPPVDDAEESDVLNPIVGTALMVVGVGMLAYGIYALSIDGDTEVAGVEGSRQLITTDSSAGIGMVLAGGVTAAAGGVVFFTQPF